MVRIKWLVICIGPFVALSSANAEFIFPHNTVAVVLIAIALGVMGGILAGGMQKRENKKRELAELRRKIQDDDWDDHL